MSTHKAQADWQTDNVLLWAMNDEPTYSQIQSHLDIKGLFTGKRASALIVALWGYRTPDNVGMSRVRWGEVAKVFNSEATPGLRMGSIKRLNKAAGKHWFDPGALAFFESEVYPNTRGVVAPDGKVHQTLFVSSDRNNWVDNFRDGIKGVRLYSVRVFDHSTKDIGTVGTFQAHKSLEVALSVMRSLSFESLQASLNSTEAIPLIISHWGKWVQIDQAVTGVVSLNSVSTSIYDLPTIDPEYEGALAQYIKDNPSDSDGEGLAAEDVEMYDYSPTYELIGDWVQDPESGKWDSDPNLSKYGFAAIARWGDVIQVVRSKWVTKAALCSPCYPGQVDLDTAGDWLGYDLPPDLYDNRRNEHAALELTA